MVVAIVALRVIFLALLSLFMAVEDDQTSAGVRFQAGVAIVMLGFALLPVETFLGQQLPIWIIGKIGVTRPVILVTLSAIAFGALHLPGAAAFLTGASAGLVLSYGFLCWRQRSAGAAFWKTTGVHAAHNALAYGIALLQGPISN